jgi:ribosome-associated protein
MPKKVVDKELKLLLKTINDSLLEKKAENVLILNLGKIENTITDFFVICNGNSSVHVNTLADYLESNVRVSIKEKPWKKEGFENCEWVLLDYVNVVVHIFQPQSREFYRLEQLWADAEPYLIKS